MASLTIELLPQEVQREFNLRRWADVLADRQLARIEGRIETDRHGQIIMTPPPGASHGGYQARIVLLLDRLMARGRVLTECPISTADGVRAADVAWASPERIEELGELECFPRAPEICVEVLSPRNTELEMREKASLYFDAGAREVWLCSVDGKLRFLIQGNPDPSSRSELCPKFPSRVEVD